MRKRHIAIMAAAVLGVCMLTAGCVTTTVAIKAGETVREEKYWFRSIRRGWDITDVTIGEGAVIGEDAFGYNHISSLILGEGVAIGKRAFNNNHLTSLTVPNSVTIGEGAFQRNPLSSLTIGEGVTIGQKAFLSGPPNKYAPYKETQISSLTLSEGVAIERNAFENNQLTSLTIPQGVAIWDEAFKNNQLASLILGEGVTIGDFAFEGNKLSSLTIGEGVRIGSSAFKGNQLTSLTVGEGVSIGWRAFAHNKITSLTIPAGVWIGAQAFEGNPLTRIVFEGAAADCAVSSFGVDNVLVGLAVMNGQAPGTYTKEGDTWLFNGAPLSLPRPARLVMDDDIQVVAIDGAYPDKFLFHGRQYLVPAGWHTVEVKYESTERGTTTYSKGTVTFEHRYLFEGSEYRFTGKVEGDQILFRIVPK